MSHVYFLHRVIFRRSFPFHRNLKKTPKVADAGVHAELKNARTRLERGHGVGQTLLPAPRNSVLGGPAVATAAVTATSESLWQGHHSSCLPFLFERMVFIFIQRHPIC